MNDEEIVREITKKVLEQQGYVDQIIGIIMSVRVLAIIL